MSWNNRIIGLFSWFVASMTFVDAFHGFLKSGLNLTVVSRITLGTMFIVLGIQNVFVFKESVNRALKISGVVCALSTLALIVAKYIVGYAA